MRNTKRYLLLIAGILQLIIMTGMVKSVNYANAQENTDEPQSQAKWDENFRFVTITADKGIFVDDLYIYEEMDEESRAVGKGYRDGLCYLLKRIDLWYYIESGDVRGFVKADALYLQEEAEKRIEELTLQREGRVELVLNLNEQESLDEACFDDSGAIPLRLANVIIPSAENKALAYTKTTTRNTVIEKDYLVANEAINIRAQKEESAMITGVLPEGGLACLIKEEGDWYYVESGQVRGFAKTEEFSERSDNEEMMQNEGSFFLAKKTVDPKDNPALYYTMTSVGEGDPLEAVRESLVTAAQEFAGSIYAEDSNFVQQIYAEYGYSIPGNTEEQKQCGTSISAVEIKQGDLVFLNGQAAIYIGSRKILYVQKDSKEVCVENVEVREITLIINVISGKNRQETVTDESEAPAEGRTVAMDGMS